MKAEMKKEIKSAVKKSEKKDMMQDKKMMGNAVLKDKMKKKDCKY
jgi:hypothetical protein